VKRGLLRPGAVRGLDPRIHPLRRAHLPYWIAGSSPATTTGVSE
jgi:hypothetical protein